MKIEYHNLYTHFILITRNRVACIFEKHRERIEKYITGIINNNDSKLHSIYANPEHVHFVVSRSPRISEELLATVVADSSTNFINDYKLVMVCFPGKNQLPPFRCQKRTWIRCANTYSISHGIIIKSALLKSTISY
jgi:REP element-mobilizing transposase RayT